MLIVEDDDQLAELLLEYLGQQGFQLSRLASGDGAAEAILQKQPDLVILDLMLPGANGLDVCRQVRDAYSGAIVMLTTSQSEADHVAGLELGANALESPSLPWARFTIWSLTSCRTGSIYH